MKNSDTTSGQLDPKKSKFRRESGQASLSKSKLRMDNSANKLDNARETLERQKPYKPPVIKTVSRAGSYLAAAKIHSKIHDVERENAAVEATHRAELFGERASRATVRFAERRRRTRPARRVRKLERKNTKANTDYRFRQMAKEHPEMKNNTINRYLQKRRLRKKYENQAREAAKRAKKTGEKAVSTATEVGRAVVSLARRHPVIVLIMLAAFLLVLIMQSCMGMAATVGNSLGGAAGASTYMSDDADMLAAEAVYAGMEDDLQYELDNYAALHPGYDEYHFDLGEIWHDPYVLISALSALHDGAWTIEEVRPTLSMLFERQYLLTETVTSDETDSYYICKIKLENLNLSHLPSYIMDEERLSRYALYMATLGNRPDLFPRYLYPHASVYSEYERYDIPPEYFSDETFAAMIAEAEKYLGYPYVWGGSSPATSFDCSGYICWVINHSGWNVGRLTAQGIHDICSRVSASDARPGDLVFFVGTYDTPGVSHVGIYVGDGMMLHCGDPIGYTSINTAYWQSKFFCFGRLL